MAIDTGSFDPIDYYLDEVKPRLVENAEKYMDGLLEKADIDVAENERLSDQYYKAKEKNDNDNETLGKYKGWYTFFWVLFAIGLLGFLISLMVAIANPEMEVWIRVVIPMIFGIVAIASIVENLVYFKKRLDEARTAEYKSRLTSDELRQKAKNLLDPVNSMFQFNDFTNIVKETTDMFEIDEYLKPEKLLMMKKVYGYVEDLSKDESIVDVMSGSIKGNPFIRLNVRRKSMFNKVYHGSRVVSYTRTYTDSEGRTRRETVTETLHASYSAPCPSYGISSYMIYGNMAAPDLKFSRRPSGTPFKPEDKELEKFVKSESKELDKMAKNAIARGEKFTPLANYKFETTFHAYDRNNEVQYRLLFTPLAQQNMVEILTGKAGFGDDFTFFKEGSINILCSRHGGETYWYEQFYNHFDYRELKKDFVENICSVFDSIFFDLAPFLAIPLYQSTEGGVFNSDDFLPNVCEYEAESFANNSDREMFRPADTETEQILKTKFVKSNGKSDTYTITSYSFEVIGRIFTQMVMAGNGVMYPVLVHWDEYIEHHKNTPLIMKNYMGTRSDYAGLRDDSEYNGHVSKFSNDSHKVKRFLGFRLLRKFDDDYDKILDGDFERHTSKD